MKMIQIRNVPDDLHRALKARAALEGTTMSELILRELPRIAHRKSLKEVIDHIKTLEPAPQGEIRSASEIIRQRRGPI